MWILKRTGRVSRLVAVTGALLSMSGPALAQQVAGAGAGVCGVLPKRVVHVLAPGDLGLSSVEWRGDSVRVRRSTAAEGDLRGAPASVRLVASRALACAVHTLAALVQVPVAQVAADSLVHSAAERIDPARRIGPVGRERSSAGGRVGHVTVTIFSHSGTARVGSASVQIGYSFLVPTPDRQYLVGSHYGSLVLELHGGKASSWRVVSFTSGIPE